MLLTFLLLLLLLLLFLLLLFTLLAVSLLLLPFFIQQLIGLLHGIGGCRFSRSTYRTHDGIDLIITETHRL
ncbi:MAG TPA: hypothetical protein DCG22_09950 [Bacteroidetes bacterium]|nr:hypothetical protein [Bacteroidota bacterium]